MDKKQVKQIADVEANKAVKGHESRMHKAKGYYKGGKTDSDMLKYGRGIAKVMNQRTGNKAP
jgi:hypothetical protein